MAAKDPYEIFMDSLKARQPIPRPQTPEDIGRAVAFFASDDASEINGQALERQRRSNYELTAEH